MDSVNPKGKCGAEAAPRPGPARLDLEAVRERLRTNQGPEFWRSLDELAATPEFEDLLHREFPRHASEWTDGVSRRRFLQLTSASLALAGLTGCTRQPSETIIPYVRQPEQLIPGKPLYFASALTLGGYALGVLAESHEGRPTKIEGNPDHPASLGATDVFAQASVLTLYDPERSQSLLRAGRIATWGGFVGEVGASLRALQALGGQGLRILTGTVTSPTLTAQIQDLLLAFPQARWHRWEPAGRHQSAAAAVRAFGRPLETRYDFTKARVILTLGGDVLCEGPAGVRYARDFAQGRRVRANHKEMSRVYAVESAPANGSTVADHRLQLPPAQVEAFTLALARMLGAAPGGDGGGQALTDPTARKWVQVVADDLRQNQGASLVVADEYASPAAQVLVHAINQALGNVGTTVYHLEPLEADPVDHVQSIAELVRDMNAGQVELLLMLDGVNPVYTAPADLPFAESLKKVPLCVHHGLYEDETSEYCQWHIPAAHELESWGDARSFDGTVSLIQPLIDPLYGGKSAHEVLAAFSNQPDASGYDIVRQFWSTRLAGLGAGLAQAASDTAGSGGITTTIGQGGFSGTIGGPGAAAASASSASPAPAAPAAPGGAGAATGAAVGTAFETAWRQALHAGLIPATAAPRTTAAVAGGAAQQAAGEILAALSRVQPGQITLLLRPDPTIWDGRFASNAWLQELPKPIVKLTWDNALIVAPRTAERLKVTFHDTVEVSAGGRKLEAAVWILPGMADDTALLTLGYGRKRAGKGTGQGFNAYALRASNALWTVPGAQVRPAGGRYTLACTQNHHMIRGDQVDEDDVASREAQRRHVVRTGTLEEFRRDPDFIRKQREAPEKDDSMYPAYRYDGHAWGMSIDLNVCTGCSSCVVACQSENNIPVVGKEQVLAGREMHWLRIDRYFYGDLDAPAIHNQPLPCMHCENAPCEVVCPVAATVHSDEGLNDMVYNRCVGTRYCSNNCPYKVRRFNFLRYSPTEDTPVLGLLQNPDVTVRMRGVMEKCTYCVQRIEQAKIESKVERRPIPANWLQTACQQACPTEAIVFGDQNDPEWEVRKWKDEPLNYGLLEELNTRPRTTYLAKLRNPNPRLEPASPASPASVEGAEGAEGAEHGHA
ncbi:MAG TPA: TAT-variant-translocated molybdopterin oxidoreductase [Thermoanaerobaculia bacterium]|nr:TAT-variant-translocated molybdopterin oxidoreductase [Thermoanaerobaculia bacterium]